MIIFIRISDHKSSDRYVNGKNTTAKQRRQDYQNNIRVPEIMKDFNTEKIPISVDVDIVFDNNHFMCYEDALKYINKVINNLN